MPLPAGCPPAAQTASSAGPGTVPRFYMSNPTQPVCQNTPVLCANSEALIENPQKQQLFAFHLIHTNNEKVIQILYVILA